MSWLKTMCRNLEAFHAESKSFVSVLPKEKQELLSLLILSSADDVSYVFLGREEVRTLSLSFLKKFLTSVLDLSTRGMMYNNLPLVFQEFQPHLTFITVFSLLAEDDDVHAKIIDSLLLLLEAPKALNEKKGRQMQQLVCDTLLQITIKNEKRRDRIIQACFKALMMKMDSETITHICSIGQLLERSILSGSPDKQVYYVKSKQ